MAEDRIAKVSTSQDYIIAVGLWVYNQKNWANKQLKNNFIFTGYENPNNLKIWKKKY